MSDDRTICAALAKHTEKDLHYFELIALRFEGRTDQIFLCIGKHALYLIQRNLAGMYLGKSGGAISYSCIERVVEDDQSDTDLLIIMTQNRPSLWPSEKLFVMSENRAHLVDRLTVAWQTDHAWRRGLLVTLPRSQQPLRKRLPSSLPNVAPYKTFQKLVHQGYYAFVPNTYDVKGLKGNTVRSLVDGKRELEMLVRVEDRVSLDDLEVNGHDHIRWVATEFRQGVVETLSSVFLLRNAFYLKKMNLANDIACWTGWEVLLKSDSCAIAAVFLRRQYIPPVLDVAQDLAIIITCPVHVLMDGIMEEEMVLQEARTVADSLTPVVADCTKHPTLYRHMIQAKLDALLVYEDAFTWVDRTFSLQRCDDPEAGGQVALRRPRCELEAWTFLRSLLVVLQEQNALSNTELLTKGPPSLRALAKPMSVLDLVLEKGMAMRAKNERMASTGDGDPVMNAWIARVARYFAFCVDGFLLGNQFTLHDLTSASLTDKSQQQKISSAILFMLHARPKEMTQPFVLCSVRHLLHDAHFFHHFTYNDRVMQSLLELGWISKNLSSADLAEEEAASASMSLDYATFLARLLLAPGSSVNLKAAICRQIIACQRSNMHFAVLLPAVMETLHACSLYLKTYATVTLVNLSSGQESVKTAIIRDGIGPVIMANLKSQDDDLTHYSLVLLTSLTKHVQHRSMLMQHIDGFVDIFTHLLRSLVSTPSKGMIVAEIAGVIGQLCIDNETWHTFCQPGSFMIDILLDIHEEAELGSKAKSKVMFALRQICVRPNALPGTDKATIGPQVIPKEVAEFKYVLDRLDEPDGVETVDLDCLGNAVQMLSVLCVVKKNCEIMMREGLVEALESLLASRLCHEHATEAPRLHGSAPRVLTLPNSTVDSMSRLWTLLHGSR